MASNTILSQEINHEGEIKFTFKWLKAKQEEKASKSPKRHRRQVNKLRQVTELGWVSVKKKEEEVLTTHWWKNKTILAMLS